MLLIAAIVAFLVLPDPWNGIVGAVCLGGFLGEVLIWFLSVRKRRVATGADTLIGQQAIAIRECRPSGQVRLRGEIWEARCDAGASRGDAVVVTGREALTLIVEPYVQ